MKIKEAVKLTGKSRTAILKALKDGKISGQKDVNGVWDIQPVDLLKYYSIDPNKLDKEVSDVTSLTPVSGAPLTSHSDQDDTLRIKVLEVELKASQEMVEERGRTIDDLRARLDGSERRVTALLSDQRQNAPETASEGRRTHLGYWVALVLVVGAVGAAAAFLYAPELFSTGS